MKLDELRFRLLQLQLVKNPTSIQRIEMNSLVNKITTTKNYDIKIQNN